MAAMRKEVLPMMTIPNLSRRDFSTQSMAAVTLLPPALAAWATVQPQPSEPKRTFHVVCVGGHPDDPESGCGGTLARYADRGHRVTIIYLTRGEAGIPRKSHPEAAAIRTAEAEAACKILGAKPVFAGQIDGATEVNRQRTEALTALVLAEQPDVLLTHWPIDTHPDHQAASFLTIRAHLASGRRTSLYFFEVNAGFQTMGFQPTEYVDITSVREKKKAALFAHRSQNGEVIYRDHHEIMEIFRGRESGVAAAEAFIALPRSEVRRGLPGLD
jgi:LmbE family N-acetylglucosaminyl deacetylase